MMKLMKINFNFIVLCGFISLFSSLQAAFKTNWDGKSVYLSSSTCKFLKVIVPEFQKWAHRLKCSSNPAIKNSVASYRVEILGCLESFRSSDKIDGKYIENLGQLLLDAQKALIAELPSKEFGSTNKQLHKLVKEIGIDVSTAVRQVYVGTAEADLKVIDNYMRSPRKEYTSYAYGLILDIIKHFDGVAITEYDFVALVSGALFVICSIE